MAPDDDSGDPKIRDLLGGQALEQVVDDATRKELEKWFGLPSFTELEERGEPALDDPEMVEVRERRAKALAAVDPALLERLLFWSEVNPETLLAFEQTIDVRIDPGIASFDESMAERAAVIGERREVEISEDLQDDLRECVPQALLRDLHRPETEFDKVFELTDALAEERVDAAAEIARAVRESRTLPPAGNAALAESRELIAEVRRIRRQKWPELFASLELANRKVSA
jgi:hypothetical protein